MRTKKIAVIIINQDGLKLAKKLKRCFKDARIFNPIWEIPGFRLGDERGFPQGGREPRTLARGCSAGRMDSKKGSLLDMVKIVFQEHSGVIFIAALGITVRLVSPLVKSKFSDPAVVSVDTAGRFAISVLSGHEGGANALAFRVAACIDALPVITTGTEVHKKFIVGIGTRRGIKPVQVKRALEQALKKKRIELEKIRLAATIELKKKEIGLLKACADLGLPLVFISKESIGHFKTGISRSEVVRRNIGVDGVCEPCALLAGRRAKLIARKEILGGVTVAIAEES